MEKTESSHKMWSSLSVDVIYILFERFISQIDREKWPTCLVEKNVEKKSNFFIILKKVPKSKTCAISNEDLIINFYAKTFIQGAKLIY